MQDDLPTRVVVVDRRDPDETRLVPCAQALRAGYLVAFPTETVYGLGADALSVEAVARIFEAKGRPADNPLIVHLADVKDIPPLVADIPPLARLLMDAFLPGPLTLVLRRSPLVPDIVTAGLDTVALRVPSHPVARALLHLAGIPVAAPSANRSGRPSPTRAEHVLQDLDGRILWLIDGGPCDVGLESTVVDATGAVPVILRPGAITAEHISMVTGILPEDASSTVAGEDVGAIPRSPGLKYRHYAPRAVVRFEEGPDDEARSRLVLEQVAEESAAGRKVGIYASRETLSAMSCPIVAASIPGGHIVLTIDWGRADDALAASAGLFDALRRLDEASADTIVVQSIAPEGIGAAYRNRLEKAAGVDGS